MREKAEDCDSNNKVELTVAKNNMLENSWGHGVVSCISQTKMTGMGPMDFCLNHVFDLDGYSTSG